MKIIMVTDLYRVLEKYKAGQNIFRRASVTTLVNEVERQEALIKTLNDQVAEWIVKYFDAMGILKNTFWIKPLAQELLGMLKYVTPSGKTGYSDTEEMAGLIGTINRHFESVPNNVIPDPCTWTYDDDYDYFDTSCGQAYVYDAGTLEENGVIFCQHCGRKIVEIEPEADPDEEDGDNE